MVTKHWCSMGQQRVRMECTSKSIHTASDMQLSDVAGAIGKGLLAGLVGTAAITASTTLEMKLRGREPSPAPSKAGGKVLGVQPRDPEGQARFATAMHWGYGAAWGVVRGLLSLTGLHGAVAGAAHFGAVWAAELAMLPALDVAPPATEMEVEEIAIDAWHHIVYAAATSAAYDFIDSH